MRNFVLGVLFTLVVLIFGGLAAAMLGYLPSTANATPPRWERRLAMGAMDAATDRRAPHVNNPVLPTDQNLIDGIKIYTMNCGGCHGGLDRKPVVFGASFYPPAPQLILHPPDDPDWRTFYVIRNGVRYTGMPAWEKNLGESDIWKVTAFLSHMEKLPQGVQDYWKSTVGVTPPTGGAEEHEGHENH